MKLLAKIGACLFSGMVAATPLHDIVVFGDSLSDNGNLYNLMKHQVPQSPPYYKGRFCNGPVWIEHLATLYFPTNSADRLLDHAFGGAGVLAADEDDVLFTLKKEVETYLIGHNDKASPDSLFVVWIGANNYLGLPAEVDSTLEEVNQGIRRSLERLVSKGAQHILLLNLPDLGTTPAAREFGAAELLTYFSKQHNQLLDQTLVDMKQKHPEVEWLFFNLNQAFNDVLVHPEQYGFSNISNTCVDLNNGLLKKGVLGMTAAAQPLASTSPCDGYLFFDLVHPTAVAHKILGERAKEMLDAAGVQFDP